MSKLHRILDLPLAYLMVQRLIGAHKARRLCVREYARPKTGERILDLGCGPGYVLEYLPACDFVGIDIDARYIDYARHRFGHRGEFLCVELNERTAEGLQPFDLILCNGLLHHLPDASVRDLARVLRKLLRASGRLMTLDGCYTSKMSSISRFLLKHDRGMYVRTREEYESLIRPSFSHVEVIHRRDLFYVPYDALVMVCRV